MDDLTILIAMGGTALALAVLARWADQRRMRRSDPDAVGFMPWTTIYFVALLVACVTLGLSARGFAQAAG
jgi:uncharacterized membrane protein YidH (DUF202 family)